MAAADSLIGQGLVDSPYAKLKADYDHEVYCHRALMTKYLELSSRHEELRSKYALLSAEYAVLRALHLELRTKYDALVQEHVKQGWIT